MLRLLLVVLLVSSCITNNPQPIEAEPIEPNSYALGIVLIGDTGTGEEGQYQVAKGMETYCGKYRCDFALLLGDNIYPAGITSPSDPQMEDKFELPYQKLNFVFHPAIGNHDHMGSWQAQVDYKSARWDMPGRWYTLGDGALFQVFVLDTSTGAFQTSKWPEQRQWLDMQLAKSSARWKIISGHYPVFSYGMHGDDKELIRYLKPMLEKHHADFYVSGHDHTKQLFERDGINYIVSGAGAKTRGLKPCGCDFAATSLGFAHLLLGEKQALLRFVNKDGAIEFEKKFSK